MPAPSMLEVRPFPAIVVVHPVAKCTCRMAWLLPPSPTKRKVPVLSKATEVGSLNLADVPISLVLPLNPPLEEPRPATVIVAPVVTSTLLTHEV